MQLDAVRVLDLTRLLPGPFATQLLADAGADVVKVEDVEAGDYARNLPPTTDRGTGTIFDLNNRGKRSVALDLKADEGRELFYHLVEDADVVFEGFRPGVVDRLGVDYDTLVEYNEDLVYCSLSGYGQTGPLADRPGHDINYVGYAGLVDVTRDDDAASPEVPGYQIGDLGGGLFAAFSILGALLSRELGGGGEYVDVSMTDVVASFSQSLAHEALTGGDPRPGGTVLTGGAPWYDVYECADGRYVTLGALEPKFWQNFCEDVDRPDLVDEHMVRDDARREALRQELTELFSQKSRDEWIETLSEGTMTAPVNTPAEALASEQVASRMVERPEDAPPRIGFPAVGSDSHKTDDESVPDHGEHTDEVLRDAGVPGERIATLRERGTIL